MTTYIDTINVIKIRNNSLDGIFSFDNTTEEGRKESEKVFIEEILKIDNSASLNDLDFYCEEGFFEKKGITLYLSVSLNYIKLS